YPALLELPPGSHPGEALKSVKEQLRRIPGRGIGYGLLRYCCEDASVTSRLASQARAGVSFNYLGQFDQVLGETEAFGMAAESPGPMQSLRGNRSSLLGVLGQIVE